MCTCMLSFRYEYDDHYFLTDPKEFIYEYNKDDNYLHNKTKETSFPKTVPVGLGQIRNKLIMDDGKYFKRNEVLDYDRIGVWDVFDKGTFTNIRNSLVD